MQLSKPVSRVVLAFASICTVLQPIAAQAQGTYTTRVPVDETRVNANIAYVDLGSAAVGARPQAVTLFKNSSANPLTLSAASFSVSGGAHVVASTCIGTLAPAASCALTVSLDVTQVGPNEGTVEIATGSSAGPDLVQLTANGVSGLPLLTSTPAVANFGAVAVNKNGGTQTVTLTNEGAISADISNVTVTSSHYAVDAEACQLVLAPGDSCELFVSFTPKVLGTLPATLRVALLLESGEAATVPASAVVGTGVQGTPKWVLAPEFQFYDLVAGTPKTLSTTLQNDGLGDLRILNLSMQGDPVMTLAGHDCPTTLAPGATCTVSVRALVNDTKQHNANLVLLSTLSSLPTSKVPLAARAQYSQLGFMPPAVDVGAVPFGQDVTKTLTLTNYGTTAAALMSLTSSLSSYTLASDCPASLAAKAACLVNVTFSAQSAGVQTGAVALLTDSLLTPSLSVPLSASVADSSTFDVSASSLDFGGVLVNGFKQLGLAVLNVGSAPFDLLSMTVQGAPFSANHNCTSVAPGTSCTVTGNFAPLLTGPATGTLTLADASNERTVALTGNGLAATLSLSAPSMTFGSVNLGQAATQSITVTNSGTLAANLSAGVGAGYSLSGGTCGATLGAGASCTLEVTFSPLVAQSYPASLSVTGSLDGVKTVSLSGTGLFIAQPSFSLSTAAVNFSGVSVGASASASVTVTNTGNTVLSTPALSVLGAAYSQANNCAASLAIGAACTVSLTFNPSDIQSYPGSLSVGFNALAPSVVTLSGVGAGAAVAYETLGGASLTGVNAPDTTVGLNSPAQIVVVRNTGNINLTFTGAGVSLPAPFFSQGSTCISATVAPGGICSFGVVFSPLAAQTYSGAGMTLSLQTNAIGAATLPLSGTGVIAAAPAFTLSLPALNFGDVAPGQTSAKAVIVTNSGNVPLSTPAISSTGSAYTLSHNCGATLAVAASCTLSAVFSPLALQTYNGSLSVGFSGLSAQTSTLTGTGAGATVAYETLTGTPVSSLAFGAIPAGQSAVAQTLVVRNTGNANLTFTGAGVTAAAPFTLAANTCASATVAPGATCSISVGFAPSAAQASNLTLSLATNGLGVGTVALSGTGLAAARTGTLALTCPASAYLGTASNCSLKVTSTGDSALAVSGFTVSSTQGGAPTTLSTSGTACSAGGSLASIAAGENCTVNVAFTPALAQSLTVSASAVAPAATTALTPVSAVVSVTGPSLALTMQNHPNTQVGSSSTVNQTLTNTGLGTVTISSATSSVSAITVNRTACTTLTPGSSCTLTTTCAPTVAGTLSAGLSVNGTPTVATSAGLSCTALAPSANVAYDPGQTTTAGGYTKSGNWVRVTNAGAGPVTVNSFMPATGWTLTGSSSDPFQCAANKVIAAGSSCMVLEALSGTQGPGVTVTGLQRITTTAGDLTWNATPITVKGLTFTATPGFDVIVNSGVPATATYTVTNASPTPATTLTFTVTGNNGLSISSSTCAGTLAAGAQCQVSVSYPAPNFIVTVVGALQGTASYAPSVSGQPQGVSGPTSVQGSAPFNFAVSVSNQIVDVITGVGGATYIRTSDGGVGVAGPLPRTSNYAQAGWAYFRKDARAGWGYLGGPPSTILMGGAEALALFPNYLGGTWFESAGWAGPSAPAQDWTGVLEFTGPGGSGVSPYVKMAAGDRLRFGQRANGAWDGKGYNGVGNLGLGHKLEVKAMTRIPGLDGAVEVLGRGRYTLARWPDGTWKGTGFPADPYRFMPLPLLTGARQVLVDGDFITGQAYAQLADGSWAGVGVNRYGNMGTGSLYGGLAEFTPLPWLDGAVELAVKDGTVTFARWPDGTWKGAGNNNYGQMGLGDTVDRLTFTPIPAFFGATRVVPGVRYTFVKLASGQWAAVGDNRLGGLGVPTLNGSTTTSLTSAFSIN